MSHTTTIGTVKITDIDALRAAVAELQSTGVQCELVERQKPRMYFDNQHGVCDYVLKLPNSPYDVGFDKQKDGSYAPVTDLHGNHVGKQIGAMNCAIPNTQSGRAQHAIGRLMQNYAKNAAMNAARRAGHSVARSFIDDQGNAQVVLNVR